MTLLWSFYSNMVGYRIIVNRIWSYRPLRRALPALRVLLEIGCQLGEPNRPEKEPRSLSRKIWLPAPEPSKIRMPFDHPASNPFAARSG